jgi:hypothetical protein
MGASGTYTFSGESAFFTKVISKKTDEVAHEKRTKTPTNFLSR